MKQTGLFNHSNQAPLAFKMRPKSIEGFFGQSQTLSKLGRLSPDNPFHFIFWGPPGCGKTTLAHIMANTWERELYPFNAVTGGVPGLKKLISSVQTQQEISSKKAIIFIDEIHRFNKAQQDVLLPFLEQGDFTLIGATTEYPQTSLNRAIISRVKIFELTKLKDDQVKELLVKANEDNQLGQEQSTLELITNYSNGDARIALTHLEYIYETKLGKTADKDEKEILNYLSQNARNYDKNSNRHYDTISAFIKSVRGSDPDAAILYLAVMLDGGEDPIFIARRLMILASEDIGNANPQALTLATSTHYTVSQIGMPEARIPLAQCTIYLACSPKSNASYLAINEALALVKSQATIDVPEHLKNQSVRKKFYKYPHNFEGGFVKQEYQLGDHEFVRFTDRGVEAIFRKPNKN